MTRADMTFYRAVGTMIGGVVGVGVFGLPYALAQSGFALGLAELLLMAVLVTLFQLMYAEVAIQTEGRHRLPGYVQRYLGKRWGTFSLIALALLLWGAMLAFMIVGGRFWHLLFSPVFGGSEAVYSVLLAAAGSALIYRGLRFVSRIEVGIIAALLFLFTFIILAALPHLQIANLATVNWGNAFVPYGVALFAFAGLGVVPELKDVLGAKHVQSLPHVIVVSMSIVTVLYAAFSFVVVGATGAQTTQAAFDGLVPVLGPAFRVAGALLGSVTVLSIFMVIGLGLQNTFRYDFRLTRFWSWSLVCGVPVVLFVLGARQFIGVIGFVGAVFAGTVGIVIIWMYERLRASPVCRRHHCLDIPHAVSWLIAAVFLAGIALELMHVFR